MDAFILFVLPPLLGYGIYLLMKNDFVQLMIGYVKRKMKEEEANVAKTADSGEFSILSEKDNSANTHISNSVMNEKNVSSSSDIVVKADILVGAVAAGAAASVVAAGYHLQWWS